MKKTLLFLIISLSTIIGLAQESTGKFGVYASLNQSSFSRGSFPTSPFSTHSLYAFELGGHMALYQSPKISGRVWLGYGMYGAQESFEGTQGNVESKVSIPGIRLAVLPAIYDLKLSQFKLSMGLGFFTTYHLEPKFEISGAESFFIDPNRWGSLSFGPQLQAGLKYQRYMLHLNVYNSLNKLATAEFGTSFLKTQGSSLALSYLF